MAPGVASGPHSLQTVINSLESARYLRHYSMMQLRYLSENVGTVTVADFPLRDELICVRFLLWDRTLS